MEGFLKFSGGRGIDDTGGEESRLRVPGRGRGLTVPLLGAWGPGPGGQGCRVGVGPGCSASAAGAWVVLLLLGRVG